MTKASIRREEREREARAELEPQDPFVDTPQSSATPISILDQQPEPARTAAPNVPHMEPPPPYDEPHRRSSGSDRPLNSKKTYEQDSCLNMGPGESNGCMNVNMSLDDRHRVEGCMNYSSGWQGPGKIDGCMNIDSKGVSRLISREDFADCLGLFELSFAGWLYECVLSGRVHELSKQ